MSMRIIVTAGFALFSMFFGSGNLVFPLGVGVASGSSYITGFLGLFCTAVVLPFVGVISMMKVSGNRDIYFGVLGPIWGRGIIILILALLGPFAVCPRCIIVSYSGSALLWPDMPLWVFSFIFCVVAAFIAWRFDKMLVLLGRYLTPILLISLGVLIVGGILAEETTTVVSSSAYAFSTGITEGYQTMDLLAGFFFSATTLMYIRERIPHVYSLHVAIIASMLGMLILGVIYMGLVFLGSKYATHMISIAYEQRLTYIANKIFGHYGAFFIAVSTGLACLTTLVVLTRLCVDYLRDNTFCKTSHKFFPFTIVLGITYLFSLFGFTTLSSWISMVLKIIYPALIFFSVSMLAKLSPVYIRLGFVLLVLWRFLSTVEIT